MRATVLLRAGRHYRAGEFARGLARHGYAIEQRHLRVPTERDLLLIWNRTHAVERAAQTYERAGARVVVAENGYLDRLGGQKFYALALGHHNGAGRWFVGNQPRFPIEDEPQRELGPGALLVLCQRGIGAKGVAMPGQWPRQIGERLRRISPRPIMLRRHPGAALRKADPIEVALGQAAAVVTWGSGAALKAIRAGLPCFHDLDSWIGNCASTPLADSLDRCNTPDRGELWRRVSWGQWTMAEVESGEAFDRLLHEKRDRLFCARQPQVRADRPGHDRGDPARGR